MKCSNCSKGIVLLVIVIGLLVGAYTVFRFGFSRVNLPPRFAEGQFKEFIRGFNRSYDGDPAEYQKRYNIFMVRRICLQCLRLISVNQCDLVKL